ncbi:MAG: hypothetical protein WB579_15745 [Bryobacteraceae bacterium]
MPFGKFLSDPGRFAIAGVARLTAKFREHGQEGPRTTAQGFWARLFDQQSS